jgi:FkbH-like protein
MVSAARSFQAFDVPRIAQLTQRSNQFNLRTVRYTDGEIAQLRLDTARATRSFTLRDAYGDYGLVAVAILEKRPQELFIDTWLMSCRVLQRGLEKFVLNELAAAARDLGVPTLVGEYLPTAKNAMVKDLYRGFGFSANGGRWTLDVRGFRALDCWIRRDDGH